MALTLCGCAAVNKDTGTAPETLRRQIPAVCERILEPVPFPPAGENDDARAAFMRDDAAIITANNRMAEGRNCFADVRRQFDQGK